MNLPSSINRKKKRTPEILNKIPAPYVFWLGDNSDSGRSLCSFEIIALLGF